MATRSLLLFLLISSILAFNFAVAASNSKKETEDIDLDDDLSFLEDSDDDSSSASHSFPHETDHGDTDVGDFDSDDFEGFDPESYGGEEPPAPEIDEKDVVVLTEGNFTEFIEKNRHVMVEFYAPWCGHCQTLAPEYAAAGTELKDEDVALAKVDATEENDLAQKYDVQGFPTVVFFVDGVHKPYPGHRTK